MTLRGVMTPARVDCRTNATDTATSYTTRIAAHDTIAYVLDQAVPGDAKWAGALADDVLAALSANGFTVTR